MTSSQGFPTADAAAIAALEDINPRSISDRWEYAGRIFQQAGRFHFTRPTTLKSPDDSHPGPLVEAAVATYHTHAGAFAATDEFFSPTDRLKATMARQLAYLGTPREQILKFTPVNLLPPSEQDSNPLGKVEVLRGAAAAMEWLYGWWTVWDGNYYYYYFSPGGTVRYTKTKPVAKAPPPPTALNKGSYTYGFPGNLVIDWNPLDGGSTRETFRNAFINTTSMNATSNRFSPLVATRIG